MKKSEPVIFPNNTVADMTTSQAKIIRREVIRTQRECAADAILNCIKSLENIHQGFQVNQLEHVLQTATRAYKANASDEWIVAALCHDMMKAFSEFNHDAMAAEVLRPYVSENVYQVLRNHQIFEGRFFYKAFGRNPAQFEKFIGESWFEEALRFTQEWDAPSFERNYDTKPLDEFAPLIRRLVLKVKFND